MRVRRMGADLVGCEVNLSIAQLELSDCSLISSFDSICRVHQSMLKFFLLGLLVLDLFVQFGQLFSSQLLMSQSILQRSHLIVKFNLFVLKLLQPSLQFVDFAYVELPLHFLRDQIVLVGFQPFLLGCDFVGHLLEWSLMQVKATYNVLRLVDLFVKILNFKLKLMQLVFKLGRKYLGVLFEDCPDHQVIIILLELPAALSDLVAMGLERQGVVCDFCHKVENGEAVMPGMRSSNGLEHVLHEVSWVVEQLEDAEDYFQAELFPLNFFIKCPCEDSKDIKKYLGPTFFQHFLCNCSELGSIVKPVDLLDDFGRHIVDLLSLRLLGD